VPFHHILSVQALTVKTNFNCIIHPRKSPLRNISTNELPQVNINKISGKPTNILAPFFIGDLHKGHSFVGNSMRYMIRLLQSASLILPHFIGSFFPNFELGAILRFSGLFPALPCQTAESVGNLNKKSRAAGTYPANSSASTFHISEKIKECNERNEIFYNYSVTLAPASINNRNISSL